MDEMAVERSITRLCHEILEHNQAPQEIVLIGIHNRGVPLAARIKQKINEFIHKFKQITPSTPIEDIQKTLYDAVSGYKPDNNKVVKIKN